MVTMTREEKAHCHWWMDVLQCGAVLVLLACWIADATSTGEPRFLDATFLSTGFCNHDHWDTQYTCAVFDFTAGLFFATIAFTDPATRAMALPTAAYLFSHGYGHLELATSTFTSQDPTEVGHVDLAILTAIICIGPINAGKSLTKVGGFEAYTNMIRALSVAAVAALVYAYKVFLANSNYALLYINISIILTAMLPRCWFIGYSEEAHVRFRVDENSPYFWWRIATRCYVTSIILLEPFACGPLVQQAGGHLLFDVSLFLDSAVELLNIRARNRSMEGSGKGVGEDLKKTN